MPIVEVPTDIEVGNDKVLVVAEVIDVGFGDVGHGLDREAHEEESNGAQIEPGKSSIFL